MRGGAGSWIGILLGVLVALPLRGAPANDRFAGRALLSGVAGRVEASNVGATREVREPEHAGNSGGSSVWWRWTAPAAGTATFETSGSGFDTILGVYTGAAVSSLREEASDDDGGNDAASRVDLPVRAGTEYQIAIDGYHGETGPIVLAWSHSPDCAAPSAPSGPLPAEGAAEVAVEGARLHWGVPAGGAGLRHGIIYGADDRLDIHEVTSPVALALYGSTVALVDVFDLQDRGDSWGLPAATFAEELGVCPEEPFRDQPVPAFCSGFLVGPDLVVTAGHCLELGSGCGGTAFVFGFRMLDATTPVLTIPRSQVYFCREVVGMKTDDEGADWAVVRLDRKVPDHPPLRLRRTGKVLDRQPLFIIGHPSGLPAKLAGGAAVRDNSPTAHFDTNLDAYGGNSGSAVFNADTLEVEGILVRGEQDFELSGDCLLSRRCADSDCDGEDVTRSTELDHLVPADPASVVHEVRFGPCGAMALLGETTERSWPLPSLEAGRTYCWMISARGECGRTEGPVWSFTTAGESGERAFIRGDASADGSVDLSDAVAILFHLFLASPLACPRSADADGGGLLELGDAVGILEHLFREGPPPAAPHPACGLDPTPGGPGCERFDPCGA